MKASIDLRLHTACTLDQAAALRAAFGVFAQHALAAGLDIRRGLLLEPHPDEKDAWERDYPAVPVPPRPLGTSTAVLLAPEKSAAPKARRG
jgi:hypothetical protein